MADPIEDKPKIMQLEQKVGDINPSNEIELEEISVPKEIKSGNVEKTDESHSYKTVGYRWVVLFIYCMAALIN